MGQQIRNSFVIMFSELIIKELKEQERAVQEYTDKWDALKTGINLKDVVDTLQDLGEGFKETTFQTLVVDFPEGFGNAVADTIMEGKSLKDGLSSLFKQLAKQVIAQIVMMVTQMLIMKAIMASMGMPAFGTGFGGSTLNSAFSFVGKAVSGLKKRYLQSSGRSSADITRNNYSKRTDGRHSSYTKIRNNAWSKYRPSSDGQACNILGRLSTRKNLASIKHFRTSW